MKHIVSVSDLHIFDDSRYDKVCTLCDFIDEAAPDLLVLNGDIGDPWRSKWCDIIECRSWLRLMRTCWHRDTQGLKTVWIHYNHDYNAKDAYLPWAEMCSEYREGQYLFMHAWEFDMAWGGIFGLPGIAPIAFWLSRHCPQLMVPLYNWLFGNRGKAPSQQKHTARDDWNYHIGIIHLRARAYAQKKGVSIIIGHTHCPTPYDGLIADDGDMVDSFSYIDITGKVKLKYI